MAEHLTDDGETHLLLSTMVQPFGVGTSVEWPNLFGPGTYEIELILSADNATPIRETWIIGFDGAWSSDESTMLSRLSVRRGKKSKVYVRQSDTDIV